MIFRSLAVILAFATSAQAEFFPIRDADWDRLPNAFSDYQTYSAIALRNGDPEGVQVLRELMQGRAGPFDLVGNWNCRTIKMGGMIDLTVYSNFSCTITQTGQNEWFLEKTTGSQRTRGVIRPDDGFYAYLGVGYVGTAPIVEYQDFPAAQAATADPSQTVPIIGEVHQMDADRIRILMPNPILESEFDILYLTR